jgi:hypothetical protein
MSGLLGWGFAGVSTIARQYMFDAVTADPRSRVTAVMSSSRQRAEDFAAERQVPAACGTLDQLLDLPDVDVGTSPRPTIVTTSKLSQPPPRASTSYARNRSP